MDFDLFTLTFCVMSVCLIVLTLVMILFAPLLDEVIVEIREQKKERELRVERRRRANEII